MTLITMQSRRLNQIIYVETNPNAAHSIDIKPLFYTEELELLDENIDDDTLRAIVKTKMIMRGYVVRDPAKEKNGTKAN